MKHFGVALSLVALVVFVGCKSAPKKEMEVDTAEETAEAVVETPEPTEEPTLEPTVAPVAKERKYRVVKDDTLWDISGSTVAYDTGDRLAPDAGGQGGSDCSCRAVARAS